jgi:hypothetical protein
MLITISWVPVFCALYLFILLLSPVIWSGNLFCYSMIAIAIGLGVMSAYSTTIFFDDYFKGNN